LQNKTKEANIIIHFSL